MKRISTFILSLMAVTLAFAGPIDLGQAKRIARDFLHKRGMKPVEMNYVRPDLEVNGLQGATTRHPSYYAFNSSDGVGFVLVSGDDSFPAVLGYSETGSFVYSDDMPLALRQMLSSFDDYVEDVRLGLQEAPDVDRMRRQATFKVVPQMINSKWAQTSPYNSKMPKTSAGKTCPVGCIATAMAQIMRYYAYPSQPVYQGSKKWNVSGNPKAGSFSFKDLTFDYANMPVSATATSSAAQKEAVATISAAASASVDMQLSGSGGGAYDSDAMQAYHEVFGYSKSSLAVAYRECYATQDEWNQLLYDEIMAGRPVQMGAVSDPEGTGDAAGHSFILDGIDEEGYLHVNWGWGGGSDAYYAIPYMNPQKTTYTFAQEQCAVIGIQLPKSDKEVVRQTSLYSYLPISINLKNTMRNSAFTLFLGEFYNYYNRTRTYTVGVGLFNKDGQFLENVCTEGDDNMTFELEAYYGLIDTLGMEGGGVQCKIPRSYPDGDYTLRLISREKGYSDWVEPDVVGGIALNRVPVVLTSSQLLFNQYSTAIREVEAEEQPAIGETEYYSIDGRRLSAPLKGQMYMEKRRAANGKTMVSKKIRKE